MKILITGSSGLLGAEIAKSALEKGNIELIGICRNPTKDYEISADICTEEGIAKIARLDFDLIIHTAAWRNPDECERDKVYCRKINVEATENLAKIAKVKGAFFFHISTDYVFSGENPPYREESEPCPVNYYGQTKAEAEEIVKKYFNSYLILRIPLLYGLAAGIEKSAVLMTMLNALLCGEPRKMEDSIVRYPTWTGDVASAVFFLIEKKATGIFHFSGQDKSSRYKMTLDFAKVLGLDSSKIIRLPEPPPAEARRPRNSQLDISKILSLGFPPPLPFFKRIEILKDEILRQYNEYRRKR